MPGSCLYTTRSNLGILENALFQLSLQAYPLLRADMRRAQTFHYGASPGVSAQYLLVCVVLAGPQSMPWLKEDACELDHRYWILRSHLILLEQKTVGVIAESAYWWHSWKRLRRPTSAPINSSMSLMKAKLDLQALTSTWAWLLWAHRSSKCQYYVNWLGIFCDSLSGDIKNLRNWDDPAADDAGQVSTMYFHTLTSNVWHRSLVSSWAGGSTELDRSPNLGDY